MPGNPGWFRRFVLRAGAVWQRIRPEEPFDFLARPAKTRDVVMVFSALAAALALALTMEPGGPPPGYAFDLIEELKEHPARPSHALPPAVQRSVQAALAQKDCDAATDALINAYVEQHPEMRPMLREYDYRSFWWLYVGQEPYQEGYVCFATAQFRDAADQYAGSGRNDYSWCGETRGDWPDHWEQPLLFKMHRNLDSLAYQAQIGNLQAMRELLAINRDYGFIRLDEVAHYAIVTHIAKQVALTPIEEEERIALAERLSDEALGYIHDNQRGYTYAMRRYGSCGKEPRSPDGD